MCDQIIPIVGPSVTVVDLNCAAVTADSLLPYCLTGIMTVHRPTLEQLWRSIATRGRTHASHDTAFTSRIIYRGIDQFLHEGNVKNKAFKTETTTRKLTALSCYSSIVSASDYIDRDT